MSNKIKSPNEKSNGFLWALLAVIVIAVGVVGFIVVNGQKSASNNDLAAQWEQQDVSLNVSVEDNAVVLKSDSATDSTPTVDLYEDFSCPHCSELAIATDDSMKEAIEQGKLVVNVRTLNFLDNSKSKEEGYSSQAGASTLAAAQTGDAKLYWNLRAFLMTEQKSVYNKWKAEDMSTAAAAFGADEETVKTIKDFGEKDAFLESAKSNTNKLESVGSGVSSPRVIKDGKDVQLSDNWVAEVTGS